MSEGLNEGKLNYEANFLQVIIERLYQGNIVLI